MKLQGIGVFGAAGSPWMVARDTPNNKELGSDDKRCGGFGCVRDFR